MTTTQNFSKRREQIQQYFDDRANDLAELQQAASQADDLSRWIRWNADKLEHAKLRQEAAGTWKVICDFGDGAWANETSESKDREAYDEQIVEEFKANMMDWLYSWSPARSTCPWANAQADARLEGIKDVIHWLRLNR